MMILILLMGMILGVIALVIGKVGLDKIKLKLTEKKDELALDLVKKEDELRIKILKVLHEVLPSVIDAPIEPVVVEEAKPEEKKDEPVV